jgi:hypothetical protein
VRCCLANLAPSGIIDEVVRLDMAWGLVRKLAHQFEQMTASFELCLIQARIRTIEKLFDRRIAESWHMSSSGVDSSGPIPEPGTALQLFVGDRADNLLQDGPPSVQINGHFSIS